MTAAYLGGNNTFVPSHEASGSLVTGFSRNPKSFAFPKYAKIIPVKESVGYYLRLTAEEAARVKDSNLSDSVWHDGEEAPMGNDNIEKHEFVKFTTQRHIRAFNVGHKASEQASWDVLAAYAAITAQNMMTRRTVAAITELTTAGNWDGNTDTCTNLGGGKWDVSGATDLFIFNAFAQVSENILKATIGVVSQDDIICLINPNTARQMAASAEIRDYVKQSPVSQTNQDGRNNVGRWGLPEYLYGVQIVIENAVKVTSMKGASSVTRSYCLPNSAAVFLSRPGGITGMEGMPQFATLQAFMYEEMTVEQKDDVDNRRTVGRVVEDYAIELAAPASGYYVTACTD